MPGAQLNLPIDRPDDRGIRSPRHVSGLASQPYQFLYPFMAHPLRPGETVTGISVRGRSNIASLCNLIDLPPMWAEMGLWVVPISALGQEFIDLVVYSGEDVAEQGGNNPGTGAASGSAAAVGNQGHMTPGLQHIPRPWAGEIGGIAGSIGISRSPYAPYVSSATYKVAREWYDTEFGSIGFTDTDLFDNPPPVGEFIRGALRQSFDQGLSSLDEDLDNQSLGEILEKMFLMTQGEYTYAEYLAAHGVNPRNAASIAKPLLLEQMYLGEQGEGNPVFGTLGKDAAVISNTQSSTVQVKDISTTDASLLHDRAPYGMVGCRWNADRSRRLFIEEPSVLLGTLVWYQENLAANHYAHHMDMTRMTHPGHWGNRIGGGIDEEDFIAVQQIYNSAGSGLQSGIEPDQSGANIINMLNLFLHGDTYASADGSGNSQFFLRQPGGDVLNAVQGELTSTMSVQLRILSDLVAT